MGELIADAGGAVQLHVIIAWNGDEQNLGFLWINYGENIHIGASDLLNGAARVGAGNVNYERLRDNVDSFAKIERVSADFELINHARIFDESRVGLFFEVGEIIVIQDHGGDLMVVNCGYELAKLVVVGIFVIDFGFERGVSVVEIWIGLQETHVLAGEHVDVVVGGIFEAKHFVNLRFVLGAGDFLDERYGLADVFIAESAE